MDTRSKNIIRVASAQISAPLGDVSGNAAKVIDAITKAEDAEVDVVVTPELALLGYGSGDIYLDKADENIEAFKQIVSHTVGKKVLSIVGFMEKDEYGFFYDSAAVVRDGKVLGTYRKVQLVNYRLFDEKRYFKPGSKIPVFQADWGKFGILICEDVWFPEPAGVLTFRGVEVIFVLSASPYSRGKPEIWRSFLKERAYDNLIPFVFTNMAGLHNGVNYWGGSTAVSASGKFIGTGRLLEEDFPIFEIDLRESDRLRRRDIRVREVRREVLEELIKAYEEMVS
jgi:NAD+ synthase (glutamine-hydrolysing)